MLFLFNKACLGQFALQFAQNLLLAEALPPELYQRVDLLISRDRLDTLTTLPIELIDQHLDKAAHVAETTEGRVSRARR